MAAIKQMMIKQMKKKQFYENLSQAAGWLELIPVLAGSVHLHLSASAFLTKPSFLQIQLQIQIH